jgi:hypothetical protein
LPLIHEIYESHFVVIQYHFSLANIYDVEDRLSQVNNRTLRTLKFTFASRASRKYMLHFSAVFGSRTLQSWNVVAKNGSHVCADSPPVSARQL